MKSSLAPDAYRGWFQPFSPLAPPMRSYHFLDHFQKRLECTHGRGGGGVYIRMGVRRCWLELRVKTVSRHSACERTMVQQHDITAWRLPGPAWDLRGFRLTWPFSFFSGFSTQDTQSVGLINLVINALSYVWLHCNASLSTGTFSLPAWP